MAQRPRNKLIASLTLPAYRRLAPQLTPVSLSSKTFCTRPNSLSTASSDAVDALHKRVRFTLLLVGCSRCFIRSRHLSPILS